MIQDLSVTRKEIDEVDKQIVKLIEQRMDLALEVAKYKISTGKPIYDRKRELEKLEKLGSMASTEFNAKSVQELFLQIMSVSRRYQYRVIGDREDEIGKLFTPVEKMETGRDTKVVYRSSGCFCRGCHGGLFWRGHYTVKCKGISGCGKAGG